MYLLFVRIQKKVRVKHVLPVAGRNFALTIPERLHPILYPHFEPFSLRENIPYDTVFTAEYTSRLPSFKGAVPRDNLYYREKSSDIFSLSDHRFELEVNLDRKEAFLSLIPDNSDEAALVFNAFKWFITFITIFDGNLPMHSSLVADTDGGKLFCGESGKGKSTISTLIAQTVPSSVRGSDELNIISPQEPMQVYPTPFISSGGKGILTEPVVLRHVFFLEHAPRHRVESISATRIFSRLLSNVYHLPGNKLLTDRMMDTISVLSRKSSFFNLFFNNDPSIAYFLKTIKGTGYHVYQS